MAKETLSGSFDSPELPAVARATLRTTGLYGIVESGQQLHSVNTKGKTSPRITWMDADQEIAKTMNHKGHEGTRREKSGKAKPYRGSTRMNADWDRRWAANYRENSLMRDRAGTE